MKEIFPATIVKNGGVLSITIPHIIVRNNDLSRGKDIRVTIESFDNGSAGVLNGKEEI